MELLIKNGKVVDGTGARPFVADILIDQGKIVDMGQWEETIARRTIDARGKIISPGFIDCHTHSEISLMHNRQHPNAVYQGITTVVTGMCGLGFAPVKKENFDDTMKVNAGIFSNVSGQLPRWESFEEYLSLLDGCLASWSLLPLWFSWCCLHRLDLESQRKIGDLNNAGTVNIIWNLRDRPDLFFPIFLSRVLL